MPFMCCRYEDNFDQVNNLVVIKQKSDKRSVDEYGAPDKFLEQFSYLLGKQAYEGAHLLGWLRDKSRVPGGVHQA